MEEKIINKILKNLENKEINISNILKELFLDEFLKSQFVNEIRRFTIIGELTNKILEKSNIDEKCKVLAIGDIKYFGDINNKWENLVSKSLSNINSTDLLGYDLTGTGSLKLRESLFNYMDMYYNFNGSINKNNIVSDIIPVYGATDGFTNIIDSIKGLYSDKKINFIYPEASFLANVKIVENILGKFNLISIKKSSSSDFFINENDIKNIKKGDNIINIYYITPVGNPTGEKLNEIKLYKILSNISENDKNSIILMDNVYVGLLKEDKSNDLFANIFSNTILLNKIIFLESLSKTLGTTGIRLGWIWSINSILIENIKKNTILKKAGFSKILGEFCINLLSNLDEISDFQSEVYDFFSKQRLEFLKDIKLNYSKYFDFDSIPKTLDREGIYILLKVKDSYTIEEIFSDTGIIGVKIELGDGTYIRYAFGNVNYY